MPVILSFVLGIFSMGFQLLGSRLLSPWFGSSIVVWAFLISTFLAAFSLGSLLGGELARRDGTRGGRGLAALLGLAVVGFGANALFARALLSSIDGWGAGVALSLTVACGVLFFPPVFAIAALTPMLVQRFHWSGHEAGFASGVIYCVGTLGNIAGIMLATFFLIPSFSLSTLLWVWTVCVAVSNVFVFRCLRS